MHVGVALGHIFDVSAIKQYGGLSKQRGLGIQVGDTAGVALAQNVQVTFAA